MRFNLLYHIYPRPSAILLFNLQRLLAKRELFDGKVRITVTRNEPKASQGPELLPFDRVAHYLARHWPEAAGRMEIYPVPNAESEATPFFDRLLPSVWSTDPDEATFFAHAKGTSPRRASNRFVWLWTSWLYQHNLRSRAELTETLKNFAAAGCFQYRRSPPCSACPWHFSGTFFWFNHREVFTRNWERRLETRYAAEAWLGNLLPLEDTHCFYGRDHGAFYDSGRIIAWLLDHREAQRQLGEVAAEMAECQRMRRQLMD